MGMGLFNRTKHWAVAQRWGLQCAFLLIMQIVPGFWYGSPLFGQDWYWCVMHIFTWLCISFLDFGMEAHFLVKFGIDASCTPLLDYANRSWIWYISSLFWYWCIMHTFTWLCKSFLDFGMEAHSLVKFGIDASCTPLRGNQEVVCMIKKWVA